MPGVAELAALVVRIASVTMQNDHNSVGITCVWPGAWARSTRQVVSDSGLGANNFSSSVACLPRWSMQMVARGKGRDTIRERFGSVLGLQPLSAGRPGSGY